MLIQSMYFVFYYLESPYFEQWKIIKKPWPWKKDTQTRIEYFVLVKKSYIYTFFNHVVVGPVLLTISYALSKSTGMVLDVESVPQWYITCSQILFFMMLEDTLVFWGHRLLHEAWIYPYMHKLHHKYNTTVGPAAEFFNAAEFILTIAIPFSAGPIVLGNCHLLTYLMWTIFRLTENTDGHSG